MTSFVKNKSGCRSKIIGHYFGDEKIGECGICDNCLSRKNAGISKQDFDTIADTILNQLHTKPVSIKELMQQWHGSKKEKARTVIEFLQAENRIEVDASGMVSPGRPGK